MPSIFSITMKHVRSKFTARLTPMTTYERFDNETDHLFLHCPASENRADANTASTLTALEAAWNVTNAIQVSHASACIGEE